MIGEKSQPRDGDGFLKGDVDVDVAYFMATGFAPPGGLFEPKRASVATVPVSVKCYAVLCYACGTTTTVQTACMNLYAQTAFMNLS